MIPLAYGWNQVWVCRELGAGCLLQIAHQVLPNFVVGLLEALAITLSQNAHGVSNSFGNTLVHTICTCTLSFILMYAVDTL